MYRHRQLWKFSTCALLAIAAALPAQGGMVDCETLLPVDGADFLTRYGGATNTVQNNATQFGDRAPILPEPTTGSEINRLFISNDDTTLYIGVTGNLPPSDALQNTLLIFIETDGSNFNPQLNTAGMTGSSALVNMDGVTLDFGPNYAIALWNLLGNQSCVLHDVTNPNDVAIALTEGVHFAVDNSNLVGVNNEPSSDPLQQQLNAVSAITGFEFAIPLSLLGYSPPLVSPTNIRVHAIIANVGGAVSNQSLPPLRETIGNTGGGAPCLGVHNPVGTPPNVINLLSAYPSAQFVNYTILHTGGTAPGGALDGAGITPANWGTPIATQNNYTCFGDARAFTAALSPGSEIDEIYAGVGVVGSPGSEGVKLFIGLTGNVPFSDTFNNTIIVFLDLGDFSGANPLSDSEFLPGGSGAIAGMGRVALHDGFFPRYAVQYWRENGQHRGVVQDLAFGGNAFTLEFTNSAARHLDPTANTFGVNLLNEDGVNAIAGDDPITQADLAVTASHGVQFSLNLTDSYGFGLEYNIGANPGIKMVAAIVSGSGFMSNQWLPPLRKTTGVVRTSVDTYSPAAALIDADETDFPGTLADGHTADNATANGLERVTGIEVHVDITHPAVEELTIDLYHDASNRTVRLWDGDGSGANMNTTFQHGAASLTTWTAPGVGMFDVHDPIGNSLITFNDADPRQGTWTLFVTDNVNGNTGTLNSWSISLREDVGGGVDCLGGHTDAVPSYSIAENFPTAEVITIDPQALLFGPGAPDFTLPHPPGTNIPDAYSTPALAVQNNYTCFGDAQPPTGVQFTSGSEMDQMWVDNTVDRLRIAIAGNLELNGNAFVVLFDTIPGGETTLAGNPAPPNSIGGNPDNQAGEPGLNGAVLDSCMQADFALSVATFGDGSYVAELTDLQANTSRLLGFQNMNSNSGVLRAPGNNAGSELNQLYLQNNSDTLFVGMTGNLEGNGNAIVILIETAGTGPNPISTAGSTGWPTPIAGTAPTPGNNGLNGDTLPAGFNPDWAIVVQRTGNAFQPAKLVNLNNTGSAPMDLPYVTNGVLTPNTYAANNDNTLGVNGDSGDVTQADLAPSATTGYQFSISLNTLGISTPASSSTTIGLVAFVTGNTGYWSNQALPPVSGSNIANLSTAGDPINTDGILNILTHQLAGAGGYTTPGRYDGTQMNTQLGTPVATQTNHTGFGNQGVDPRYSNDNCVMVAFNNANSAGVTGCQSIGSPCECLGGDTSGAAIVDTGMEVDIALADLGLPPVPEIGGPTIRVLALLTGGTGFASNQFLPGLGGEYCNLGFGPNINLAAIPGDQCLAHTLEYAVPCGAHPADINGDGLVNMDDVADFVDVLLGVNTDFCPVLKADINPNPPLGINGNDIQAFVTAFLN